MFYLYCAMNGHDFDESYDVEELQTAEKSGWIEKNGNTIIHHNNGDKHKTTHYTCKCKRRCRFCGYIGIFRAEWNGKNPIPEYTFLQWA